MQFLERVAVDFGAAAAGVSTAIGGRLRIYEAMAGAGPLTSQEVADRAGLSERYIREWLALQVANEYVVHRDGTYLLPDEHAMVLANPSSPAYLLPLFGMLQGLYGSENALAEAFRSGDGVGWEQHSDEFFTATAESFRTGYAASLVQQWLPAVDGAVEKLTRGASVADVGCGHGLSTILMAQAFPQSRFTGYDLHPPSIEAARIRAEREGVAGRVNFEIASASDFPGSGYDLVTLFDCLHDLGDPAAALKRVEESLAPDGSLMIVEPNAPASLDEVSPIGRVFFATSPILCLPAALAEKGPHALGNHPDEAVLSGLAADAGLRNWRLAAEGPVNRVYDVRR